MCREGGGQRPVVEGHQKPVVEVTNYAHQCIFFCVHRMLSEVGTGGKGMCVRKWHYTCQCLAKRKCKDPPVSTPGRQHEMLVKIGKNSSLLQRAGPKLH